jgi:hypothetical protein
MWMLEARVEVAVGAPNSSTAACSWCSSPSSRRIAATCTTKRSQSTWRKRTQVRLAVLQKLLTQGRRLDTGNPRSDALENDFGRLGFELLPALRTARGGMHRQLFRLNVLIDFRNLVSHGNEAALQNFVASNDIKPTLTSYKRYRRTVTTLVGTMDRVVAAQLASGLRVPRPW